jgi:D-threo-aldose 1-dehydrogenase
MTLAHSHESPGEPTKVRPIPHTQIGMTQLGLGCGSLGGLYQVLEAETAYDAVAAAHETGIRYFDTAPIYSHGLGEKRLGEALAGLDRDSYVLGTKVGITIEPITGEGAEERYVDPFAMDATHDFSYDACMRSFEGSLERLDVDRIDIAYIHDPDMAENLLPESERTGVVHFDAVMEGAYRALHELRDQGVVRSIGIGMFGGQALADFANAAEFDVFLYAGGHTLLEHDAVDTLLPLCEEKGIALVIGAVLKSGILATGTKVPNPYYDYRPANPAMIDRVRRIEDRCEEFGISLLGAALQFPVLHPAVVSVIPGAKSRQEVEQNVNAMREDIPQAFWETLKADGLIRSDAPTGGAS